MPLTLLLALAAAAGPPSASRPCPHPVAPDERAARRIAERVIAARPGPPRRTYVLRVVPDRADPRLWVAFQVGPTPGTRGGGGLEMRIDRCTGAVGRLHHSR
jgi:hypothetical protein